MKIRKKLKGSMHKPVDKTYLAFTLLTKQSIFHFVIYATKTHITYN